MILNLFPIFRIGILIRADQFGCRFAFASFTLQLGGTVVKDVFEAKPIRLRKGNGCEAKYNQTRNKLIEG
jgi:hypothetical protein